MDSRGASAQPEKKKKKKKEGTKEERRAERQRRKERKEKKRAAKREKELKKKLEEAGKASGNATPTQSSRQAAAALSPYSTPLPPQRAGPGHKKTGTQEKSGAKGGTDVSMGKLLFGSTMQDVQVRVSGTEEKRKRDRRERE